MEQNRVQKEMYTYVIPWFITMLPLQTLGEKMVFSIKGTESTGYLNGKKKAILTPTLHHTKK